MQCEECGKAGAKFYVDYSPQGDVVHQFDPDIWELCPACAAETTYVRPDEYIEFLEACLEDEKLKQINSKWLVGATDKFCSVSMDSPRSVALRARSGLSTSSGIQITASTTISS